MGLKTVSYTQSAQLWHIRETDQHTLYLASARTRVYL